MSKMKTPFLYKFGRILLKPIYKLYYAPKIIGRENLNVKGAKIIASNHIHLYDQCNTIISTKEFITYMAKKEYFEGCFAWFFRLVGCIPVDRSKKDDYAVASALSILTDNKAVGIFPEGTRNALKKEKIKELYLEFKDLISFSKFKKIIKKNKLSQVNKIMELYKDNKISKEEILANLKKLDTYLKVILNKEDYYDSLLLDLKYGTVSMASKKNAYIIPCVITGKYKFRSHLTVKFGKPFKVDDMNLDDANRLLRKNMIELLVDNMKV